MKFYVVVLIKANANSPPIKISAVLFALQLLKMLVEAFFSLLTSLILYNCSLPVAILCGFLLGLGDSSFNTQVLR